MAIETKQTSEEVEQDKQTAKSQRKSLESDLSSDFAKSSAAVEAYEEFTKTSDLPTEEVEEKVEEEDDQTEEEQTEEQGEEQQAEEDEDLIPQSKFNKRVNSLTAQNKALEAKLNQMEAKIEASKNPRQAKIEAMTTEKIEQLLLECDQRIGVLIQDPSSEGSTYAEASEVRRMAEQALRSAPEREQTLRQSLAKRAADDVISQLGIEGNDKAKQQILDKSSQIYGMSKTLQSKPEGYAEAIHLAAGHFQEVTQLSVGKSNVTKLKRENNKLKKKTSLDGKVISGDAKKHGIRKSRDRAHSSGSEFSDKLDYAKESGMLGDLSRFKNQG